MKNGLKLYFNYISVLLRSTMQYKTSFFLSLAGQVLLTFNEIIAVYFLFARFNNIKGFTFSEIMLCFSIVLMSFSVAESYARGFDSFSNFIVTGDFDRFLLRPRSLILQVLGSKFEFARVGSLIQGIVMLGYGIAFSNITWNALKIFTLAFMLLGGVAVFTGLFLIYAALCFFTVEGLEFVNIFTDGARTFGAYPVSVYGKKILKVCTFIIPYSLFQYYPLLYLFGKTQKSAIPFFPLLAFLFLIPCYALWRYGVKKYKSTGS